MIQPLQNDFIKSSPIADTARLTRIVLLSLICTLVPALADLTLAQNRDPNLSQKTLEILLSELKDPDLNVRNSATQILGKVGDNRAVTSLITMLNESGENVRSLAVWLLGRLADLNIRSEALSL